MQRTLAIVVDDLSLSFESVFYTRRALRTFVERELLPTDLVALVRTGQSMGSLQSFTTDRRVLQAAIDSLQWNLFSRSGVESFDPVEPRLSSNRTTLSPNDFEVVTQLRRSMAASGTLGALILALRGTRDLPGRKAIILVTEGFQLFVKEPGSATKQLDSRLRNVVDRVIDQATRAGVVIYALDARGLLAAGIQAADNFTSDVDESEDDRPGHGRRAGPLAIQSRYAGRHGISGRADRWLRGAEHQRSRGRPRAHHQRHSRLLHHRLHAANRHVCRQRRDAAVSRAHDRREAAWAAYQDAQGVSWRQRSAGRADDDDAGGTAGARGDVAICSDRPGAQGESPAGIFERAGHVRPRRSFTSMLAA